MPESERRVAVALGGGGAKGIVHVGVLKAVDALGLSIDTLVGTSIGGIWCSLYANTLVSGGDGSTDGRRSATKTVEDIAYQLRFSEYRDLDLLTGATKGFIKAARVNNFETPSHAV